MTVPVIVSTFPTGSVRGDAPISAVTTDPDDGVDPTTIDLEIAGPSGTYDILVAGVEQTGWSTSINANNDGGYDVLNAGHHWLAAGSWTASIAATDFAAHTTTASWNWTVDEVEGVQLITDHTDQAQGYMLEQDKLP